MQPNVRILVEPELRFGQNSVTLLFTIVFIRRQSTCQLPSRCESRCATRRSRGLLPYTPSSRQMPKQPPEQTTPKGKPSESLGLYENKPPTKLAENPDGERTRSTSTYRLTTSTERLCVHSVLLRGLHWKIWGVRRLEATQSECERASVVI
jgi:hypothetical protein